MTKQYTEVELVYPNDPRYLSHSSDRKRVKTNNYDKSLRLRIDPISSDYNAELRKWEYIVLCLLAKLFSVEEKRILRYTNKKGKGAFREIDLIVKSIEKSLILCELKLKEDYKRIMPRKNSGRRQLNKTQSIIGIKYDIRSTTSICVDMSYIYNLQSNINPQEYTSFSSLTSKILSQVQNWNLIWLNSREVKKLAIEHGLISNLEADTISILFKEYKDPMLLIEEKSTDDFSNCPFKDL